MMLRSAFRAVVWSMIAGALAGATRAGAQGPVPALTRAEELLDRNQLREAERAFVAATRSPRASDRAFAFRSLALIAWRNRGDDATARAYLDSAFTVGVDTGLTLLASARHELERGRAAASRRDAARALSASGDGELHRMASRALLRASIEPYLVQRIDGERSSDGGPDSAAVAAALRRVQPLLEDEYGTASDAYLILLAALIVGDGDVALSAWRRYFAIDADTPVRGALAAPERELGRLLPLLRPGVTARTRDAIVLALADSRLFTAAALVARAGPRLSRRAEEIVAYAAYTRRLERATNDYYRRLTIGRARPDELNRIFIRLSRGLWPRLVWPGGKAPRYYPAAMSAQLALRFGAVLKFGNTGGFYDLHYGHRLVDESHVVEQYGHRATVRFVALDGMVSNGFQSWAWDGRTAHAGWQVDGMIVQVRTTFASNPRAFWILESDSARHAREAREIAADSAEDWTRAAIDSAGYLPGVAGRLRRDGRRALADSLRAMGLVGARLEHAFIAELSRVFQESAVFAHEGRHAIDAEIDPRMPIETFEFDAKLSEVAFSSRPKLALGGILHADIGDVTPHGRANARVMLGLIRWMRAHATEIAGFDASRPVLPQLPLLTDAQLRAAFRSMDPLAR